MLTQKKIVLKFPKQGPKKPRQPRKDFADRLAEKIRIGQLGSISEGILSDLSGRWLELKVGKKTLCFFFDVKGEKLTAIKVFKDIFEKVDSKQIF